MSQPKSGAATIPPTPPPVGRSWLAGLLAERSVQLALVGWALTSALILVIARGSLPFDRPALAGQSVAIQVVAANVALLEVFGLMAVAYLLTRHRTPPDIAARVPAPAVARRETLLLLGYAVLGLVGGFGLGRGLGWHPISFHVVGTLYGTHAAVGPGEVLGGAVYNFVVYAAVPYLYFRRRYSAERLNLTSTDRGNDALVIVVVLAIEALFELLFLSHEILRLGPRQLLLGGAADVRPVLRRHGAADDDPDLRHPCPALPQADRIGADDGHPRRADLHADALLRRLDGIRLARQRGALGLRPALDLLRAGHDQDRLDAADGERLGPRLRLPRRRPAHPRGYAADGQGLRHPMRRVAGAGPDGPSPLAPGRLGEEHRLDAVADQQLLQDVGPVVLDDLFAEAELDADLLVAVAGGDAFDDLPLALGQLGERALVHLRTKLRSSLASR